jgi:MFS family permease
MMLISLSLFLFANLMYMNVNNLSRLLLLRFIHGIGFALANTTLYTVVADLISEKRRGEGLGYFATFMNFAMVIGPFLGLSMIARGLDSLFFIAFILGMIAAQTSYQLMYFVAAFWTVFATEVNLLKQCTSTIIILWEFFGSIFCSGMGSNIQKISEQ